MSLCYLTTWIIILKSLDIHKDLHIHHCLWIFSERVALFETTRLKEMFIFSHNGGLGKRSAK